MKVKVQTLDAKAGGDIQLVQTGKRLAGLAYEWRDKGSLRRTRGAGQQSV